MIAIGKIFEFFKNPRNTNFAMLVAIAILLMLWLQTCSGKRNAEAKAEQAEKTAEQNERALTDSLKNVKNKAGDMEAIKSSFVAKMDDLAKLNKDLYAESKKEIGDLKAIIKGGLTVNAGGVTVANDLEKYDDQTFGLKFDAIKKDAKDSLFLAEIKGVSKFKMINNVISPGNTEIIQNKLKMGIVLGFTEEKNGDYKVFARSKSDNITFDQLNGALIIPKKADILCPPAPRVKRFGVGPSIGYGFGLSGLTPYVGISFNYNIIQF